MRNKTSTNRCLTWLLKMVTCIKQKWQYIVCWPLFRLHDQPGAVWPEWVNPSLDNTQICAWCLLLLQDAGVYFWKNWLLLSGIDLMTNFKTFSRHRCIELCFFILLNLLTSCNLIFYLVFEASCSIVFTRTNTCSMLNTEWSKPKWFPMCTCYILVIIGSNVSCNLCYCIELLVYKMLQAKGYLNMTVHIQYTV